MVSIGVSAKDEMGLSRWESVQHLLRIGLLSPAELVSSDITAAALSSRNHLVRVEWSGGGAIIKQPKDPAVADAATMWTEASLFWLTANDAAFAPLARWMPRFFHYDEPQRILTIEHIAPAASLAEKLLGEGVSPALSAEAGRALATLHGPVSRATVGAPSRWLFASLIPWVLTIGAPDARYVPLTSVSAAVLRWLTSRPAATMALQRLRSLWEGDRIIHGDAKAPNLLVVADGTIRIIDWEIAAIGDGLWDVAGLIHSMLIPNPAVEPEPLDRAQARARAIAEPLWHAYAAIEPPAQHRGDAPSILLAMTGARIVQTCLESTHYGVMAPGVPAMLEIAEELMARPAMARQRWNWRS